MLTLTRLDLADVDWARLDALPDRVLFQKRAWLDFLADTQDAEPVVAVLRDGGRERGWFTGLVVRRFGVRVLGGPMPGWSTQYMGWNLLPGTSRSEAWPSLTTFAFDGLRCVHLEVCDRGTIPEDLHVLPVHQEAARTFRVDLSGDLDAVRGRMAPGTRQNMRKAERSGVVVEDAAPEGFAAEYYSQLEDVFAKQSLVPTYTQQRVERLVAHLHPTGDLQLVRARDAEGMSVATALFLGHGATAYFWGGASPRSSQRLRPNEPVFWHAFATWAQRGVREMDLGGGGDYKRKYGATELVVPWVRLSRFPVLGHLRDTAKRAVALRQQATYALRARAKAGA